MQKVIFSAVSDFYKTRTGIACMERIQQQVKAFWPDVRDQKVLGIGYAGPGLCAWNERNASDSVSAVAARYAHKAAGSGAPWVHTLVAEPRSLPFQEKSFDRIILMHGFEKKSRAVSVLRAASDVLRDDGRMLLIFPDTFAGRFRLKKTPFMNDSAFSSYTLRRLLALSALKEERKEKIFFLSARHECLNKRFGYVADIAGRMFVPGLGGLCFAEVTKNVDSPLILPSSVWQRRWRRYMVQRPAFLTSFVRRRFLYNHSGNRFSD